MQPNDARHLAPLGTYHATYPSEIQAQASGQSSRALARRYGVTAPTVRKWRERDSTHISDAVVSSSVNLLHTAQANALQARHYSSSPFLNDINALNTYRAGTDSRSFYYDSLDRLTRLDSRRYGSDRYSYDALGNVRSRQFGGSTRSYSYDASHNRISSMPGAGALSYDDRGNVSQAGTFTLTRNRANELIGDALGSSFAYDARGWRVKKHVIAGATHTDYFIYDSNHRLMERIDNGTRSDFVCLGQKAIARITNNKPSYIFGDYQNSPLFESNSAGSVTRAPNFVGYGHPDSTGVSEIPGYSGAAPDAETGLLYLGARYLYAERFLSPDPAALDPTSPVGLNRYAYANDNPARYVDPFGKFACSGPKGDCALVSRAWHKAHSAVSNLPAGRGKSQLSTALWTIGAPGDTSTGVTVVINGGAIKKQGVGGGTVTNPDTGKSTIGLVMPAFGKKPLQPTPAGLVTKIAGALTHEAQHVVDERADRMPRSKTQEMGLERSAYGTQAMFYQAIKESGPFSIYDPTGGATINTIGVERAAGASTAVWCSASGAPGC